MKLIIDIPDSDYTSVRCEGLYYIGHDKLAESVTTAFQTAIPLPEELQDEADVDETFDLIRTIYKREAPADADKHKSCAFCINHCKNDTLYESSSWDGGIGFDYIRGIRFCPICGKELGEE